MVQLAYLLGKADTTFESKTRIDRMVSALVPRTTKGGITPSAPLGR
ncbi:hypothetical protein A2U01_0087143, partial [Trifolium medium]|nr:hypothetical protein [Trifolium medium]